MLSLFIPGIAEEKLAGVLDLQEILPPASYDAGERPCGAWPVSSRLEGSMTGMYGIGSRSRSWGRSSDEMAYPLLAAQVHGATRWAFGESGLRPGGIRTRVCPSGEARLCRPGGQRGAACQDRGRTGPMGCLEIRHASGQRRAREHIGLFSRAALRNATRSPPKRMQTVCFALLRDSQHPAGADPARTRKGQGARRPELREDKGASSEPTWSILAKPVWTAWLEVVSHR